METAESQLKIDAKSKFKLLDYYVVRFLLKAFSVFCVLVCMTTYGVANLADDVQKQIVVLGIGSLFLILAVFSYVTPRCHEVGISIRDYFVGGYTALRQLVLGLSFLSIKSFLVIGGALLVVGAIGLVLTLVSGAFTAVAALPTGVLLTIIIVILLTK